MMLQKILNSEKKKKRPLTYLDRHVSKTIKLDSKALELNKIDHKNKKVAKKVIEPRRNYIDDFHLAHQIRNVGIPEDGALNDLLLAGLDFPPAAPYVSYLKNLK